MLNMIENDKFLSDKHTEIQYLPHEQEAPTTTADLPASLSRL